MIDLQLKPLPRDHVGLPARYLALSYVWESDQDPYTTSHENIRQHLRHGGFEIAWDRLPRAIQDAITLVQKIGERYLWVDRLCIVQDSPRSFKLNADNMHVIYGHAYLTICAADGVDSRERLIAMHSKEAFGDPASLKGSIQECAPGLRLLVSRPPEMVIQNSNWNTRTWTFQERLLSRRCLIFASGRVYFQCRSTIMSQEIYSGGEESGWSFQSMNAPLRNLLEIKKRCLWFYIQTVSLFSVRKLSHPEDILAAFRGVASVMQLVMAAPFYFGLPTSHFDLALLWQAVRAPRRRKIMGSNARADYEFPSWSWCGWENGKIEYDSKMLDGCVVNVREWLREHTWISWYFRDSMGRLRPLWDRKKAFEDNSIDTRWRGYAGLPPPSQSSLPP